MTCQVSSSRRSQLGVDGPKDPKRRAARRADRPGLRPRWVCRVDLRRSRLDHPCPGLVPGRGSRSSRPSRRSGTESSWFRDVSSRAVQESHEVKDPMRVGHFPTGRFGGRNGRPRLAAGQTLGGHRPRSGCSGSRIEVAKACERMANGPGCEERYPGGNEPQESSGPPTNLTGSRRDTAFGSDQSPVVESVSGGLRTHGVDQPQEGSSSERRVAGSKVPSSEGKTPGVLPA
jgi:hypothetical protein